MGWYLRLRSTHRLDRVISLTQRLEQRDGKSRKAVRYLERLARRVKLPQELRLRLQQLLIFAGLQGHKVF
jgi:hypothetical protein